MSRTISFTDTLVVVTCWCGMNHAIPDDLNEFQHRQWQSGERQTPIYCPLGHVHIRAGEGEAAKLRRQIENRDARIKNLVRDRDTVERSLRATKGQVTKLRNRIANGVCPVPGCKRSGFSNVRRHIASKHPEWAHTHEEALS